MPAEKYQKFYQDNLRSWSQWIEMFRTTHVACCDCGLVHTHQFKLVPVNSKRMKLVMRTRRHVGRTKARRQQKKHRCR